MVTKSVKMSTSSHSIPHNRQPQTLVGKALVLVGVWKIIARNLLQAQLLTPASSLIFITGKLINLAFTLLTVFAIFSQGGQISGYNLSQAIIAVLIFNLVDSISQFLFRSLYSFRPVLIRGDFDLDLLKPLPSYFRPILSGPDFLDTPLILIQIIALVYYLSIYSIFPDMYTSIVFLLVLANSIIIAFSVHLSIAAFAIITTEIDNLVMVYRTLSRAAIVPTSIYSGLFRFVLDYIVPITLIFTFPAQALVGLLSPFGVVLSSAVALMAVRLSLSLWRHSLRHYASASS